MRSRSIADWQDANSGLGAGDSDINFSPLSSGPGGGAPPNTQSTSTPVAPVLPDESIEAMTAVSGSGAGGTGSVVAETSSSGFTINLIFDAAAMAAPASFRAGIEQAAAILSATITNKITVNINIDYSGTGGGAAAGPDNGQFESYSTVRSDLIANAAPGDASFNALPTGSTIQGQSQVAVWNTQLKLFGLLSPNSTTTDDGSATFATDINPNLLVGVALHELTHAMGRVPYGTPDGPQPDIFDFYRFTSAGTYLFTDNIPASSAYFSLNGGATKLADFGVNSDPSDFLNSGVQGRNDPFNEFYSSSTLQSLTAVDKQMLDALGFDTTPLGLAVVSNVGNVLQGGPAVALLSTAPAINDPGITTLSGATVKIANTGGSAVAGDELFVNGIQNGALGNGVTASWNTTTDTLTLSGTASISVYDTLLSEVTFQDTGIDSSSGSHPIRTVTWTINDGASSYSATSLVTIDRLPVIASKTATDFVGSTVTATAASGVLAGAFDLDADALTIIGVSDTAHGTGTIGASLAGTYGHLTLNVDGSYSYVSDNTAAISSGPTGAHLQDVFTYAVSDSNGGTATASLVVTLQRAPVLSTTNLTLNTAHAVAASSLFSASDPDGNTITTYAVENSGPGHFLLNNVIEPNNQEIDVTAAQLSQLTYQGVTGSTADTIEVRVNDGTLWSSWTSFTVTPTFLVQTDASTSLFEVGNNFEVEVGGTGPTIKYQGAAVTVGEFGTWTPIGAIQTASGYDVAWKDPGSGQYEVWAVDNNGNFISAPVGIVPGTNTALESIETTFNQDLNGDGSIGIPPPPPPTLIRQDGSTSLYQVGNNFEVEVGGTGPTIKYQGAAVTVGEFGTWTPIGAVQTASGYDVAWKDPGSGQYEVWAVDNNGNFISAPVGIVAGSNTALESIETTFNQDLNGDGSIGIPPPPPPTLIKQDGSTSLYQVGNSFAVEVGGTGPTIKYQGAAVTVGEFGDWTPIGAIQTSSGYDVAWKDAAGGQYEVWALDSNGNFISAPVGIVPGSNAALESIETTFNQDLNGDGSIGPPPPPPPTLIKQDGSTSLYQVGNNFEVEVGGTGPTIKYQGAAVTVGEFGTWTPIGAIQTASGYDVAWKDPSSGLYEVWAVDNNGNFVSTPVGIVPGTNTALESIETTFNQDLNGDGHIGVPAAIGPVASGSATTNSAASVTPDNFHFASNSGGTPQALPFTVHPNNATTAPGNLPAMTGHDSFVFALDSMAANGSNVTPTGEIPHNHAAFANIQAILSGVQDMFGNAATHDAAPGAPWQVHHGDFHLI